MKSTKKHTHSSDICPECKESPCVCMKEDWVQTGKTAKHMATGEKTFEWAKVDKEGKRTGERCYKNASGKVMGEGTELGEASSPQKSMDFDRMMKGAMSRAEYNSKWKKPLKPDSKVIYGKNVKSVKEESELDEATTVDKKNYSWGKMVTVHHGANTSFPLHPEHQKAIKKLRPGMKTTFKDETGRMVHAHREGDNVHLTHHNTGSSTATTATVGYHHFDEGYVPDHSGQLNKRDSSAMSKVAALMAKERQKKAASLPKQVQSNPVDEDFGDGQLTTDNNIKEVGAPAKGSFVEITPKAKSFKSLRSKSVTESAGYHTPEQKATLQKLNDKFVAHHKKWLAETDPAKKKAHEEAREKVRSEIGKKQTEYYHDAEKRGHWNNAPDYYPNKTPGKYVGD